MTFTPAIWKKGRNSGQRALELQQKALAFHPPPIWFTPKKAGDKHEKLGSEDYKEVKLVVDHTEKAKRYVTKRY